MALWKACRCCPACKGWVYLTAEEFRRLPWWRRLLAYMAAG